MKLTILEDAKKRKDLFHWNGTINELYLDSWLRSTNLKIPDDLRFLWVEVGGGNFLESETILSPTGDRSLADDVESVNSFHKARGMPVDYLVIHLGLGDLTALRLSDQKYVQLDQNGYREKGTFGSFEAWYNEVIRSEYGSRYGLVS